MPTSLGMHTVVLYAIATRNLTCSARHSWCSCSTHNPSYHTTSCLSGPRQGWTKNNNDRRSSTRAQYIALPTLPPGREGLPDRHTNPHHIVSKVPIVHFQQSSTVYVSCQHGMQTMFTHAHTSCELSSNGNHSPSYTA